MTWGRERGLDMWRCGELEESCSLCEGRGDVRQLLKHMCWRCVQESVEVEYFQEKDDEREREMRTVGECD